MKHAPTEVPAIAENLIKWYDLSGRHLPWRAHSNPYAIWLSEIILQQTRVEQGLKYWERFLENLPNLESLAKANIEDVKGLWSGLGYYRRADLLHRGAKKIAKDGWPKGFQAWLSIPGVGPYTAAALASIIDKELVPALDGNAYRVYSRLADWAEPIETSRSKAFIASFALERMHPTRAGDHNQAIMDLAQAICTPKNPKCTECPLENWCESHAKRTIEFRPVKARKKAAIAENLHFAIQTRGDYFGLIQRPLGGIWSGLYTPPPLLQVPIKSPDFVLQHKLSHRHFNVHFYSDLSGDSEPEVWLTFDQWKARGIPQVFVHWFRKFAYI